MNFKKQFLIVPLLLLTSYMGFSQTSLFLEWKIKKGDTLKYKTTMSVDYMERKDSSKIDTAGKSLEKTFSRLFRSAQRMNNNLKYQSNLFVNSKNNKLIDVEMKMVHTDVDSLNLTMMDNFEEKEQKQTKKIKSKKSEQTDSSAFGNFFKGMAGLSNNNIVLRGRITTGGEIVSDYYKNAQRNIVATLFALPNKPVRIGEKWALNVSLIEMDQNFYADSSSKINEVYIDNVIEKDGDRIAVINYRIEEYVTGDFNNPFISLIKKSNDHKKATTRCSHIAIGNFSITKGKWLSYEGTMTVENNFLPFNGSSITTYRLVE